MKYSFLILWIAFSVYPNISKAQDKNQLSNAKNGLGIKGHDPVAYFNDQSKKGSSKLVSKHKGVVYHFISQSNKQLFDTNPDAYIPQYGGWCAYAMGNDGTKVDIDPHTYKLVDGKLYLFYNKFFTNTLDYWNDDEQNLMKKADENWAIVSKLDDR